MALASSRPAPLGCFTWETPGQGKNKPSEQGLLSVLRFRIVFSSGCSVLRYDIFEGEDVFVGRDHTRW